VAKQYRGAVTEIRGATWADFDRVYELLDARSRASFGISELKPAYVRAAWELPGFTVGEDNWVVVDGPTVLGYAALGSDRELVHTAAEAADGDRLLAAVEARARALGFATIATTVVPEDEPLAALVDRSGFARDREILRMWRALDGVLPGPSLPAGVDLRPYEPADALSVHALLDEAYAGWDDEYVERSHEDWLAFMTEHDEFDPGLWLLAERDGALVGCVLLWLPTQGRGWVKDLVVRSSERGAGLGKALLHAAFKAYAERGIDRVGLKVDSNNPTGAPELYERVGFVTDRRYQVWSKRL